MVFDVLPRSEALQLQLRQLVGKAGARGEKIVVASRQFAQLPLQRLAFPLQRRQRVAGVRRLPLADSDALGQLRALARR